jgi:hypothetical protein
MNFTDAVSVAGTRRTDDGYLVAEARAVRTGVQLYAGSEVGRQDLSVVRVYRAADQVFDQASLQSFTHAPVTMDHPAENVTAENWKDLAIGEVSTAAKKDGEWVHLPLILKDASAIKAVESGKRELSAGYTCDLDWASGTTADGQAFDAQQKNIKINHLALVDRARAGSKARIGDGAAWGASPFIEDQPGLAPITKEKDNMSDALKTVVLGDKAVQVAIADVAAIEAFKAEAAKAFSDANTAYQTAIAAKDTELAKRDAKIDELTGKVLSDADLDKRVQDRADLISVAKMIAKDVKTEGLTDAAIRKAVVVAKFGDAAVAGKADAYIDARFDLLVEDAGKHVDQFRDTVGSGIRTVDGGDIRAQAATAKAKRNQELRDAWKGAAA